MSERITSVRLMHATGMAIYGRESRAEMIARYKQDAEHQRNEAQRILDAPDEAFIVETYIGVHAQRNKKIVEE